ncbi:MAG: FecR domain-containing protein [Proteobacteria bacterium]|nr:FecR domain-containing protein [Pseudomonadota bacterium]
MHKCSVSRCLILLVLLAFSSALLAAHGAAEVIVVIGSAWTETEAGERFSILEGQQISAGTTLVTENGAIQLAFRDGGFISIQKNTRFRIERFEYNESEDGAEWALFELLKGGMRAISGAIGHARAKRYGVRTSYGTIGIRGTAYNVLLCEVECVLGNRKKYMQGLHAETLEGTIFIENTAGVLDVPAGRSAHVKNAFTLPEFSTFSPNFVLRKAPPTPEESEGDDDSPASNENGESAGSLAGAEPAPDVATDAESSRTSDTPAILATDTQTHHVRILSRPGRPLVVGTKADMTRALTLATAEINGNVMAPIVGLNVPTITRGIVTERTVPHLTRSKAAVNAQRGSTQPRVPHAVRNAKIASVKAMIAAQKVNTVALANTSAKANIALKNLNSISHPQATAGTIR